MMGLSDGLFNASAVLNEFVNGSTNFENTHRARSQLARILFSYDSVNKVYTPILFLFGAIGNCLSVTVFCMAPTHRHLSSSYYLSALAISDTGFLINLLAVWLEDMGYPVITTQLTCPLVMYLGQVTCFLSVWLTVSFTVERFFAVCYPLTRPTVCTVARAKRVISALTLLALVAFSYVWLIARALEFPLPPGGGGIGLEGDLEYVLVDKVASSEDLGSSSREQIGHNFSEILGRSSSLTELPTGFDDRSSSSRNSRELPDIPSFGFQSYSNGSGGGGSSYTHGGMNGSGGGGGETIRICTVREEHTYISGIANHIDSLITLILPFVIITYLNVRIALCVWKLRDQRRSIVAAAKISSNSASVQQSSQNDQNQQQIIRADHPSQGYRLPASRSSPLLNGTMSLGNHGGKSCRINVGSSTTSLNTCHSVGNAPAGHSRRNQSSSPSSAAEARVTKTLLLVSTAFLVLNLPAHAIRAVAFVQSLWGLAMVEELQAAQQWANILFNTNFSVNFLLYCVSGRNFRKSLWSILFSVKTTGQSKRRKTPSSRATSQQHRLTVHHTQDHHQHPQQHHHHHCSHSREMQNQIVVTSSE